MLRDALIRRGISNREADVAAEVSKGKTNIECANALFVTEKTIKFHLTSIYKKLGIKSRSQLIVWAMPYINFHEEPKTDGPETVEPAVAKPAIHKGGLPPGSNGL